jgi:TIR domain
MVDTSPTTNGWIFINYRREDTAYAAGWLYDRLADRFGDGKIFKDIDSIELGDDFAEVITNAVASCDVLLALVGDQWLTITDEEGSRRLGAQPTTFRFRYRQAPPGTRHSPRRCASHACRGGTRDPGSHALDRTGRGSAAPESVDRAHTPGR